MRIVTQLSGGADSVLANFIARDDYPDAEIYGVFVDYRQQANDEEYKCAVKFANRLGITLKVVTLDLWEEGGVISNNNKSVGGRSVVYTPLRNLVLTSITASIADEINAPLIYTGNKTAQRNEEDEYSFLDSSTPFFEKIENLIQYTQEDKTYLIEFRRPVLNFSKHEIYDTLKNKYGVGLWDTFNCFYPVDGEPCMECKNCKTKTKYEKSTRSSL